MCRRPLYLLQVELCASHFISFSSLPTLTNDSQISSCSAQQNREQRLQILEKTKTLAEDVIHRGLPRSLQPQQTNIKHTDSSTLSSRS